jgi:hypothetical protein
MTLKDTRFQNPGALIRILIWEGCPGLSRVAPNTITSVLIREDQRET